MVKRIDRRTGAGGAELRYETAPDSWVAEQLVAPAENDASNDLPNTSSK